jgi:hypothetical protein
VKEWDPDEALASLKSETDIMHDGNPKATADKILTENVAAAASQMIWSALHSPNEKIRMDASKYVLERVLGPVKDGKPVGEDPLSELLVEAAKAARGEL